MRISDWSSDVCSSDLLRRRAVDRVPVHRDPPAGRQIEPGDDAQQGGLATARGADKGDDLVLADGEVDAVERAVGKAGDGERAGLADQLADIGDLKHCAPPAARRSRPK